MSLTSKITRENLDKFLSKYTTEEKTLDIGSGGSSYDRFFPNRTAIDVDPERKPDIVADAHKLPFNNEEFGTILCTEVLEHLHSPETAISEMERVLKKDGLLILTTRFIFPIHDAPNDYYRFTKYGLRHLFRNWEIVDLQEETNTKDTFAVLFQRIGFQTKLRFNKASKFLTFLTAKFIQKSPQPILKEYGDIKKTKEETNILTSGYYLICRKR